MNKTFLCIMAGLASVAVFANSTLAIDHGASHPNKAIQPVAALTGEQLRAVLAACDQLKRDVGIECDKEIVDKYAIILWMDPDRIIVNYRSQTREHSYFYQVSRVNFAATQLRPQL